MMGRSCNTTSRSLLYPVGLSCGGGGGSSFSASTLQTIASQLAPLLRTALTDDCAFEGSMFRKLAAFAKSMDLLMQEYRDGHLFEVTNLLTSDVYAQWSLELNALALDPCTYPDYEQLRTHLLQTVTGLYKSILEHDALVSLEAQLSTCREKVAMFSDPVAFAAYLARLRQVHPIFPDTQVTTIAARIKPQYSVYISRYGFPANGIFDPVLLGSIMDELSCCV